MLRSLSLSTLLMISAPAWAEDVQALAPVTAVTIYPNGATLTRTIEADLSAGQHRILFPMNDSAEGPPRIAGDGVVIGAIEFLRAYVTDAATLYSPSQQAAFDRVEGLKDQVAVQANQVALREADIEAAQAHVTFLGSISAGSLEEMNPDALRDVGAMVAGEVKSAKQAQQAAVEAAQSDRETLAELQKELTQAQQDLARLSPPQGPVDMLAVTVDVAQAGSKRLDMQQLVGGAYWRADYDLRLDRDAGRIDMARKVVIQQNTGEAWEDVAVTLSTADPAGQINPREVYPNMARITELQEKEVFSRSQVESLAPQREADSALVQEDVSNYVSAGVQIDGLSITYNYPEKINLGSDQGLLVLALDQLQFDAEIFNRAAPRYDETAFLMAKFTNAGQEPLLPGEASLYRDGVFIGRSQLQQVPAGSETEVAFGALEALRLEFTLLKNDTGDTGILTSSSTRTQSMEFTVENLSTEAEKVEAIFPIPFAEQEDLNVRVRSRPSPDSSDFEKRRGVSVWNLDLKAGEKRTVRVDVDLAWPEGQMLQWNP